MWDGRPHRRRPRSSSAPRAAACGRSSADLRRRRLDPAGGRASTRSTSASPRGAPALRGARRQRAWLSRPSTSSTASTCSAPAGSTTVRALVDRLASFVALRGARGVVVFDGVGEELDVGPLAVRFAPHADELLERLAAEHRGDGARLPRLVGLADQERSGQEVMKRSSRRLRPTSSARSGRSRDAAPRRLADRLDEDTRASSSGCAAAAVGSG